jgi:hypothetical protein
VRLLVLFTRKNSEISYSVHFKYVLINWDLWKTVLFCTSHVNWFFFLSFMWRFDPVPAHGLPLRCFTITLIGHTTLGRTPLYEWSARHRYLSLTPHKIQHLQDTNIHASDGIRTHNPRQRAAEEPRLRPRGHWDRYVVGLVNENKFKSKNYI